MPANKPNILWITLDSVRADHTSVNGYQRETTPELSRIANSQSGFNFQECIAHGNRTPVSVSSILTGLYPISHQMLGEHSEDLLPDSILTIPEILADAGYHTICVSENWFAGEVKGFDKRFHEFTSSKILDKRDLVSKEILRTLPKYISKLTEHGPGFTSEMSAHGRQSSLFTTDIAKQKLKRNDKSDQPFFCYLHLNDPHHPYIPPKARRSEFLTENDADPEEAVSTAQKMGEELYEWMAAELPLSRKEWDALTAMYDATIKYTDNCVGNLFDYVQSQFEDTITVITSDHGDLFGEYGLLGHNYVLHDGLVHVPLVTHGIDDISHPVDMPVQHIDIMQTILSSVGADNSHIHGKNIRNHTRKFAISQELTESVADDNVTNYNRVKRHDTGLDLSHLPDGMITAIRSESFKLLHSQQQSKLYHLPDENDDVYDEYKSKSNEFIKRYGTFTERKTQQNPTFTDTQISNRVEERLDYLGYR